VTGDGALERTTLAKVTRRLLPFLFLLYIVCFLDRVNLGFAALQMNRDLGFSPAVYGFGAGIFFLGSILFEVPSNLMLARVGARAWDRPHHDHVGAGVVRHDVRAQTAQPLWAPVPARGRRSAIARFMVAIPLSGVIGGPLSGALLSLLIAAGSRGRTRSPGRY
jgi:MFS transporter, ACS family, tartrate transporter